MTAESKIAELEKQLTGLQETHADLRRELVQARVDRWQGRIEDLEVQVHLATMDTDERIDRLTEQLRNTWDRALTQMSDASSTASTVAETVLVGLESAYGDVREALLASRDKVSR